MKKGCRILTGDKPLITHPLTLYVKTSLAKDITLYYPKGSYRYNAKVLWYVKALN